MSDPKVTAAVAFINTIREMEAEELHALIVRAVGEDLAQFFLNYTSRLLTNEPDRFVENGSSLMLMGYLLAKSEQHGQTAAETIGLVN